MLKDSFTFLTVKMFNISEQEDSADLCRPEDLQVEATSSARQSAKGNLLTS